MSDQDVNDFLLSGGVPGATFDHHGATVQGTIVHTELRNDLDMDTRLPKTWEDGSPMKVLIVDLITDERDPKIDADDGTRRLWIRGNMIGAVRNAVKKGGGELTVGGWLKVSYEADGTPKKKGWSAPKLYSAEYTPPRQSIKADDIA